MKFFARSKQEWGREWVPSLSYKPTRDFWDEFALSCREASSHEAFEIQEGRIKDQNKIYDVWKKKVERSAEVILVTD